MYKFWLGGVLFPVTPAKMYLKIKNQNKTINLINEGEVNLLKNAGLTDVDFELLIPAVSYNFSAVKAPNMRLYLDTLERLKVNGKPFQFIVKRTGKGAFDTNLKVTLEDYEIKEDWNQGRDLLIPIKLKQYRDYGVKIVKIPAKPKAPIAPPKPVRPPDPPPKPRTYTVKSGDTLWYIAASYYGNGAQYPKIFDANRNILSSPHLIFPGQTLVIPN